MPISTQGMLLDGRYRVIRHLGSGGMATVVLCTDERLGREVAVKRLHADSPADVEQRFAREARVGASLNHPNLVSVFDTSFDDEGVLIVMEYVSGEPLSRALRQGRLGPRRVARMATELGAALDHAHGHGVVHRDVKPGNVLLRDDGVTKLADLGIATVADGTRITRSGTVLGTASYMAPEQLEGKQAGAAADVYAMAAVCFEALSGQRPRTGKTPIAIAHSIATEPPPDLRDHWPAAPAASAELLLRGMARAPEDRPGSAGELGRTLARSLEEPATAAPVHTAATAPLPAARKAPLPATRKAPLPVARNEPVEARPRRRTGIGLLVVGLAALAAAALAIALGGGDEPSERAGGGAGGQGASEQERNQRQQQARERRNRSTTPEQAPAPTPPADDPAEDPASPAPAPDANGGAPAPAGGAELNDQGFQLLQAGRYEEAVPVLQRAVDSYPAGTGELGYAYALFNLGKALRLAGRPEEAVPILEQRLGIPNQTGVVRRELALARQAARG